MKTFLFFLALIAGAAATTNVDRPAAPFTRENAGLPVADLLVQSGAIGIFDSEDHDNFASLEARLRLDWQGIRPWLGITIVDSGAWFTGAGLIYDFATSEHTRITVGSGPFYYAHGPRGGDDLGLKLEFYSFVEAAWQAGDGFRTGVRLGHLSNAGLGRRNPGTEILGAFVSVPLSRL